MKNLILISTLVSLFFLSAHPVFSQQSGDTSMKGASLSLNPLGFLQFGPILNAEIGVNDHVVLNGHIRFASMGLVSKLVMYDEDDDIYPDALSGTGIGGGVLYFFGEKRNKPYFGGMLEYHNTVSTYNSGSTYEWEAENRMAVILINGGYRFRFDGGFFVNTGAFIGAAVGDYNWYYTNPEVPESGRRNPSSSTLPFGMLELTIGVQF